MRVFNICYILMSEFLYAMSSPPSSSVHRFQPRSLPFTGIEGASTGQRVEGASRSGQVMQHLDDLGIRPTEKLIPIKDTPSSPTLAVTSPEPRLAAVPAVKETAKRPKPPFKAPWETRLFDVKVDAPLRPPSVRVLSDPHWEIRRRSGARTVYNTGETILGPGLHC
ncbi:hypothetical protein Pst134EA_022694 [Puccinia striiformis f. sp. tritici]|uniref:hypothetical protein n=1 Tax=Puccinia striiformis f. sp. tritici TaxID=168172 RepID=UPI0020087EDB|nr:hypothetical protein Pst134EA_022694 [Puccinia striiformis f. sp. tritici]KAH9455223.1 hypothetical protein Pst134EA_022694 [Puccinia striiformis f. sp. tritici]